MSEKLNLKAFLKPIGIIAATLVCIYIYPRFLINTFGESSPWTSYLYLYGFGGAFFGSGIVLILKTGACVPGRGMDGKWLNAMFLGLLYFACLHAIWIYLALSIPFKGEGGL